MASKLKVELLKQKRLIFLSKGLVGASNYDKKRLHNWEMIERGKERFQLTKTERMDIDPQRDRQKTRKFHQLFMNKPYSFNAKRRQT